MQNTAKRILVVDDDNKLRELLVRYLGDEGFEVSGAANGAEMDDRLQQAQPDLVVLDLMMPGEDGLSIARRLRSDHDIPIIILSARGDEIDRIVGLEVGADDYLAKPFNPRELLARIRAVLRRATHQQDQRTNPQPREQHRFGDFTLNLTTQTLTHNDKTIELTAGDFTLLEAFVTRPNRVLSRDTLIELLKGYERSPFDRSIDVRVTRLRKKIEPKPDHPQFIRTIWGRGYMFTPQADPDAW